MFKLWQNTKRSSKILLSIVILVIALVVGWFSDFIPNLILNHYRSEYAAMKKDPETGFPSLKDRTDSNGESVFMAMAFWYDMAQQRQKARDCYMEALYRYGYESPAAPEIVTDIMQLTFHGSNADTTEQNAVLYYWLFAVKYNEKHESQGSDFVTHPNFLKFKDEVDKMVRSRGGRVILPTADNDYELVSPMVQGLKDNAARQMLVDFILINSQYHINDLDTKAVGDDDRNSAIPLGSKISEFSIKDWE